MSIKKRIVYAIKSVLQIKGDRGIMRHLTKKPRPVGEVAAKPTERALRTRALALSSSQPVILSEVEPEDEGAKRIHPRASEGDRARNL